MRSDWLNLLKQAVTDAGSQAAVGRELGYSPAVINQALQGKYPGDLEKLAEKVVEVYGNERVVCPILGSITLAACANNQKKPFSTANPLVVDLWATCPDCKNYRRK